MQVLGHMFGLPLNIVYLSDGNIAFTKKGNFPTIFDIPEEGINAVISQEELLVGSTRVVYNTVINYKAMPELLQWLKQQNLENPVQ